MAMKRALSIATRSSAQRYTPLFRHYTSAPPPPKLEPSSDVKRKNEATSLLNAAVSTRANEQKKEEEGEEGALTRRLDQMAEDALSENPRFMKAAIESGELGFSAELKERLLEKIAKAEFQSIHVQANLPSSAGQGTRDIAMAKPWTGDEAQEDTVLRMLVDAHKPLRGDAARRRGGAGSSGINVDLRPSPKVVRSAGQRLSNARDRSTEYAINKELSLSEKEKAEVSEMFKERFQPGARPVASVAAISSLADQRIEEARARGQFKNLPRGKPLERDHNADSPFLDTTEYFLNKIIKHQEIVPPWIEKQQELVKARDTFRTRLRVEWKRHAARIIASEGGSLDQQIEKAEKYAEAEKALEGGNSTSHLQPFRDKTWEKTELSYHNMAIENLNSITRSYNLLAPELAKKPYFSLERELSTCYAEAAPQLARELINRAKAPKLQPLQPVRTSSRSGIWENVAGEHAKVHDDTKPTYGFREFWRDMFSSKSQA